MSTCTQADLQGPGQPELDPSWLVSLIPQERVELLEQVTKEHADFQAHVEEFQLWLKASVDKANSCLGPDSTLTTKDRLLELQVNLLGLHQGCAVPLGARVLGS